MSLNRRSAILSLLASPFVRLRRPGDDQSSGVQAQPGAPPVLNVRQSGAVGDGNHDDSPAFKTALAAVAAAGAGASLYVPSGHYRVGGLSLTRQSVRIWGDGETSVLVGPASGPILSLSECPTVSLKSMALATTLSGTGGSYALLDIQTCPEVALTGLRVEGSGGDGVEIGSCDGIDIAFCTFTKAARFGLRVHDNTNLSRPRRIHHCVASENGQIGIVLQRIAGFDVEGNLVLRNRSIGIHATTGCDWLRVLHNRCSANGTSPLEHGVYVLGCRGVVVQANSCFGNAGDGILLRECNDSVASNNVCADNHRHGMSIQDSDGEVTDAFVASGNVAVRNTEHGLAATGISRALFGANLAADNTRFGLAGYAGPKRALSDLVLSGNLALGNKEGALLLAGASSAAVVGNIVASPAGASVPALMLKDFESHQIQVARSLSNVEMPAPGTADTRDLRGMGNMIDHLSTVAPLR